MKNETLRELLQSITFIEVNDISRHAKGLLKALENSNRKEFLDYEVKEIKYKIVSDCCESEINYGLGMIGKPIRCEECGLICREKKIKIAF